MKKALVVGGTSGLGAHLGTLLSYNHDVVVTGRTNRFDAHTQFAPLDLNSLSLAEDIENLLASLPPIDVLVYAAGFFQEGTIDVLDEFEIERMIKLGLTAPALLLRCILRRQHELGGVIAITSTSQWTPRLNEPVYTGVKAGLGMLANSVSLDSRVGKVLVAAPSGMKTPFWDGYHKDVSGMLDPEWVANQILRVWRETHWNEDYKYKFVRILRNPRRIESVETRLS